MIVMGNPDDISLNQLFQLYISQYLEAKKDFENAVDGSIFLDGHDFFRYSPEEIIYSGFQNLDLYSQRLQLTASALSAFIAVNKDHIHFD